MELGDIVKKNMISRIIILILSIFIILLNTNSIVSATIVNDSERGTVTKDPTINPGIYKYYTNNNENRLQEKVGIILGVINVIGIVVSVITLMIIGIKYMFGSIEEKADYKKTALTYCIGALLVFSGTTIPNILYKIATNFM